jgi:hypothetical protein
VRRSLAPPWRSCDNRGVSGQHGTGDPLGVLDVLKRDEGSEVGWAFDPDRGRSVLVRRLAEGQASLPQAADALEAEASYCRRLEGELTPSAVVEKTPDGEPYLRYEVPDGVTLGRLMLALEASGRTLSQAAATAIASDVLETAKAIQRARARTLTGSSLWGHGEIDPRSVLIGVDGVARLYDARFVATGFRSDESPLVRLCRPPEITETTPAGSPSGDVYSVGALLALGVLGPGRLMGTGDEALVRLVQKELTERGSELDDGFGFVLTTALAQRERERFENCNVMRIALKQCAYLDDEDWSRQRAGLGAFAELLASEDAPSLLPESLLAQHVDVSFMSESAEPTMTGLRAYGLEDSEEVTAVAAQAELDRTMEALGLPSSPSGQTAAQDPVDGPDEDRTVSTGLTLSALAMLDEVSERALVPKVEPIPHITGEQTRNLDLSSVTGADGSLVVDPSPLSDDGPEDLPTREAAPSEMAPRVRAETVAPSHLSEKDALLMTMDAELLGATGHGTITGDSEDFTDSRDLMTNESMGESSLAFESVTDEVEKPTARQLGGFDDAVEVGAGLLSSQGSVVEPKPKRAPKYRPASERKAARDPSAVALPGRTAAPADTQAGPLAEEFDDDFLSAVAKETPRAPTRRPKSQVGSVPAAAVGARVTGLPKVPSVADRIPNLGTGALLADAIADALADESAPLPQPSRPSGRAASRPRPVHSAKLVGVNVPRRASTLSLPEGGIPLEALDPVVAPAFGHAGLPPSAGSIPLARDPVRPTRRLTQSVPPPRFEEDSGRGRVAFLGLAALVLGVGLVALVMQDRDTTTGAALGVPPVPVPVETAARRAPAPREVPTPTIELPEERKTVDLAAGLDLPPAKPETPEETAEDRAAREAYGATDTLEAAGGYDSASRSSALGVWRIEDSATRATGGLAVEGKAPNAWERELASAPAYAPDEDTGYDDEGYGGRDTASAAAPSDTPYAFRGSRAITGPRAGKLVINVIPWGNVFVDGRSYGYPPVVVQNLTAGTHVIRVERPGFETVERPVVLAASKDESVHIRFKQLGEK